jgi:predicted DNA-binding ribbon-helix-helix protein
MTIHQLVWWHFGCPMACHPVRPQCFVRTVCHHLGFSSILRLSIVGRWVQQLNCQRICVFLKFPWSELTPLISRDGLRYTKLIENMFYNKINHIAWCHNLDWDGLNPLCEVICRHQYEFMTFARWWVYLSNQINRPTSERSWLDYWVHCWCWNSLNASKLLTLLASFVVFEAIFQYRRPIINIISDHPLHLECRLMGSTDPSWFSPIKVLASSSPRHLSRTPSMVRKYNSSSNKTYLMALYLNCLSTF